MQLLGTSESELSRDVSIVKIAMTIDITIDISIDTTIVAGIRLVTGGFRNPTVTYPISITSVMAIDIANNGYIATCNDGCRSSIGNRWVPEPTGHLSGLNE